MIDAYSLWNSLILIINEYFLHIAVILNVIMTAFLILQNTYHKKLFQGHTLPTMDKSITGTNKDVPPFVDGSLTSSFGKQTEGIDLPKIERAIKMIKDGYSLEDIKNVVDIEASYISILQQNYNVAES
jgi:hypothetical protein